MAPNETQERSNFSVEQLVAPCGRQQPAPAKGKVEHNENLGTYKAAITPLLVLTFSVVGGVFVFKDIKKDKRVEGFFLTEAPVTVIALSYIYVLASTVWGPRFMKDKKPLSLKTPMLIYNAFQVVLSTYMFIEIGLGGWFGDYNWRCQECDFSMKPQAVRMARVSHLFFLSKILDFVDTALFIARGKLNQVSNLHVIHHSTMVISMLMGVRHFPGGHITFLGFLNSFIHSVMYSYYLLAGLGPKVRPFLWWKKYLTRMQLTQFVMVFLHSAQLLVFPCDAVPTRLVLWTLLYAFIYFALFSNFYLQAYLSGGKKKISVASLPTEKEDVKTSSAKLDFAISAKKSTRTIADVMESKPVQRIQANLSMAT